MLNHVVDDRLQRNGYFAHPEHLVTMLFDERSDILKLAAQRIIQARKSVYTTIRCFQIPLLNFGAKDYVDLIK